MELRNLKEPGYTQYKASDTGHIYDKDGKMVHECPYKGGYLVSLLNTITGKKKLLTLHRLIALTFIDTQYETGIVKFRDGNKYNCNVDNLYWVKNRGGRKTMGLGSDKTDVEKYGASAVIESKRMRDLKLWQEREKALNEMVDACETTGNGVEMKIDTEIDEKTEVDVSVDTKVITDSNTEIITDTAAETEDTVENSNTKEVEDSQEFVNVPTSNTNIVIATELMHETGVVKSSEKTEPTKTEVANVVMETELNHGHISNRFSLIKYKASLYDKLITIVQNSTTIEEIKSHLYDLAISELLSGRDIEYMKSLIGKIQK